MHPSCGTAGQRRCPTSHAYTPSDSVPLTMPSQGHCAPCMYQRHTGTTRRAVTPRGGTDRPHSPSPRWQESSRRRQVPEWPGPSHLMKQTSRGCVRPRGWAPSNDENPWMTLVEVTRRCRTSRARSEVRATDQGRRWSASSGGYAHAQGSPGEDAVVLDGEIRARGTSPTHADAVEGAQQCRSCSGELLDAFVVGFGEISVSKVVLVASLGVQPMLRRSGGGVLPAVEQQVRSVDPCDRGARRELDEPVCDHVPRMTRLDPHLGPRTSHSDRYRSARATWGRPGNPRHWRGKDAGRTTSGFPHSKHELMSRKPIPCGTKSQVVASLTEPGSTPVMARPAAGPGPENFRVGRDIHRRGPRCPRSLPRRSRRMRGGSPR